MRDWSESVMCKNGHRWTQDIIADENGQHSLADWSANDCPECGMCIVDCDGCELCAPSFTPTEYCTSDCYKNEQHGPLCEDARGGSGSSATTGITRSVDSPARSPFERQAFAICDAFGRIAAESLRRR